MSVQIQKRVTVKLKCPNPLFEQWLINWRDEAIAKESKLQYSFNKALESLRKYPLPLESGRECLILKGFGERMCNMLDSKLKEHRKNPQNAETHTKTPIKKKTVNASKIDKEKGSDSKLYVPQRGSGAYAILITLYKESLQPNYPGFLKKSEIIEFGKDLVNSSFTKPEPGSRYTAWSSMRTLISKKLVSSIGRPPKFSLTQEGGDLAKKMYEKSIGNGKKQWQNLENNIIQSYDVFNLLDENEPFGRDNEINLANEVVHTDLQQHTTQNKLLIAKSSSEASISTQNKLVLTNYPSASSISSTKSTASDFDSFIMAPYSFDIILYIDTQETSGSSNSKQDEVLLGFQRSGIKYEVKNLKVGDFTWICRDRVSGQELILPYIVERKRMDDFAHSIKDKRYYEQKFRLKRSGIENLTYLVESHGNNQYVGLPYQSLCQAATNTAIQEDFFIKFTENIKGTIQYLVNFSQILTEMFQSKTLASCPKDDLESVDINKDIIALMTFKEFNNFSVKNKRMNVTDLFVKMLIQIKGMSVERALAITQKYPTPLALKIQYENDTVSASEKLLSSIRYGPAKKAIGAVLSKTVYQAFCKTQY